MISNDKDLILYPLRLSFSIIYR